MAFPPVYTPGELQELQAGVLVPHSQKTVTFNGAGNTGSLAAKATIATNLTGANNDLDLTATTNGTATNGVTVQYVDPGIDGASLLVQVNGRAITVMLATGVLTAATTTLTTDNTDVADGETFTLNTTVYRFKNTLAQIRDIKISGVSADATLLSAAKTINGTGVAGTDMFAGTPADPNFTSAASVTSHHILLTAKVKGAAANSFATTTTATHLSFTGATAAGGVSTDTITSTSGAIITAIAAETSAAALITPVSHAGNDGTGVVTAMAPVTLVGGSDGYVPLFTVKGSVLVALRGYIQTTPTGTNATLVHGITGSTNLLITILTATTLTARKGIDSTGLVTAGTALAKTPVMLLNDGENIIATVATAAVATGKILYICDWVPLTSEATVTAS